MKISIIGFGNLGRALASGLVKSQSVSPGELYVCDNSPEALKTASAPPYNANASDDVNYVIQNSCIIFIVVKGYVLEQLAAVMDKRGFAGKTVVSFMAGVTMEKMQTLIAAEESGQTPQPPLLVRAMPSLGIAVCDGVIGHTKAPAEVAGIFRNLGIAYETAPENIEKFTAFSGCGPGFAAYLLDAFAAAGMSMGFTPEMAEKITELTFKYAVSRGSFKETIKAVATPGGATEQGILHMTEQSVPEIIEAAMQKAYKKMES